VIYKFQNVRATLRCSDHLGPTDSSTAIAPQALQRLRARGWSALTRARGARVAAQMQCTWLTTSGQTLDN